MTTSESKADGYGALGVNVATNPDERERPSLTLSEDPSLEGRDQNQSIGRSANIQRTAAAPQRSPFEPPHKESMDQDSKSSSVSGQAMGFASVNLPLMQVSRIVKSGVSERSRVRKDAVEVFSRCTVLFGLYLSQAAQEHARKNSRKGIVVADVVGSLTELGFSSIASSLTNPCDASSHVPYSASSSAARRVLPLGEEPKHPANVLITEEESIAEEMENTCNASVLSNTYQEESHDAYPSQQGGVDLAAFAFRPSNQEAQVDDLAQHFSLPKNSNEEEARVPTKAVDDSAERDRALLDILAD